MRAPKFAQHMIYLVHLTPYQRQHVSRAEALAMFRSSCGRYTNVRASRLFLLPGGAWLEVTTS